MKLWLPQILVDRINWISREVDVSRPDIVRACLFEHLYGRVAMLALHAHKRRQDAARAPRREEGPFSDEVDEDLTSDAAEFIRLLNQHGRGTSQNAKSSAGSDAGHRGRLDVMLAGTSQDIIPSVTRQTSFDLQMLGKSDGDLTFTLPRRLKEDLADLAARHKLTPSSYTRKMLVLMLLGEPVHTSWQQAIGKISKDVERLEQED
ncbi:hypothetical protein [Ottowia sp. VDI28]|uniref:hypothetical protein n=1 Tax=Ottowia sp. VDI28 TaxID=3133968 RepID=UPI003C2D3B06